MSISLSNIQQGPREKLIHDLGFSVYSKDMAVDLFLDYVISESPRSPVGRGISQPYQLDSRLLYETITYQSCSSSCSWNRTGRFIVLMTWYPSSVMVMRISYTVTKYHRKTIGPLPLNLAEAVRFWNMLLAVFQLASIPVFQKSIVSEAGLGLLIKWIGNFQVFWYLMLRDSHP